MNKEKTLETEHKIVAMASMRKAIPNFNYVVCNVHPEGDKNENQSLIIKAVSEEIRRREDKVIEEIRKPSDKESDP